LSKVDVTYTHINNKKFIVDITIIDGLIKTIIKYDLIAGIPKFSEIDQTQLLLQVNSYLNDTLFYSSAYYKGHIAIEVFIFNKLHIEIRYSTKVKTKLISDILVRKDRKDITSTVKSDFIHWPMLDQNDIDFIKLKYS
jgi:hypothetical protein